MNKNNQFSNNDIKNINARYSKRFLIHGFSPLTLGWSNSKQQNLRFSKFASMINNKSYNNSILDIGCGFGDFLNFLKNNSITMNNYTGVDINPVLIKEAIKMHGKSGYFFAGNLLDKSFKEKKLKSSYDYVFAMGIFNLNFANSKEKMYIFFENMIIQMTKLSKIKTIIDFIPKYRLDNYKEEEYIMTYDLDFISKLMQKLSLRYTIDCTQRPNPMSESLLIIEND